MAEEKNAAHRLSLYPRTWHSTVLHLSVNKVIEPSLGHGSVLQACDLDELPGQTWKPLNLAVGHDLVFVWVPPSQTLVQDDQEALQAVQETLP